MPPSIPAVARKTREGPTDGKCQVRTAPLTGGRWPKVGHQPKLVVIGQVERHNRVL